MSGVSGSSGRDKDAAANNRDARGVVDGGNPTGAPRGNEPIPNHGLDRDFPLLMEKARAFDFAERLGGCTDPLMAEIDAALRELWDARSYLANEVPRG